MRAYRLTIPNIIEFSGLEKWPELNVWNMIKQHDALLAEEKKKQETGGPYHPRATHFLFTDPVIFTNGRKLANYIEAVGFGTITTSRVKVNPNSGNELEAFLWVPNLEAMRAWKDSPKGREDYDTAMEAANTEYY